MTGLEAIAAANELLDDGVTLASLLRELKGQLIGRPEAATQSLATVLNEITKSYEAIDQVLSGYLGVQFNPDLPAYNEWNAHARAELVALESGNLKPRIAQARGHSAKIDRIYQAYLSGWFQRLFGGTGKDADLKRAILDLWGSDGRMVRRMYALADSLADEAQTTLSSVDNNDLLEANRRICVARIELSPFRRQLSANMAELRELESDFSEASGVIGV